MRTDPATDPASDRLSDEALEFVARRFRLLGEPQRLRILRELMERERSVTDLALLCDTSQANVSKHLGLMAVEGMVAFQRQGNRKLYRIADPSLVELCHVVCDSLEERFAARLRRMRGD